MIQIYHVWSENDSYFNGIVLASSFEEARDKAWAQFTAPSHRGGMIDGVEGWRSFHRSRNELEVELLGDSHFRTDGEGRLEF